MQAKNLKIGALFLVLLAGPLTGNAQIGNVRGKITNTTGNIDLNKNKKEEGGSSSNNSVGAGMSCDELAEKADALYAEEKYQDAWKYYEQAEKDGCVGMMDGMTRMNMNNCREIVNTTPEEQAEQEKMLGNLMNQIEDQKYHRDKVADGGISSEVHRQNVGKIVFAKEEIVKGSENPSAFANSFSTADNIYSRVYLEQSMANYSNEIGAFPYTSDFDYLITVNGYTFPSILTQKVNLITFGQESFEQWTTFQIGLSPKTEDVQYYPQREYNVLFWENIYHLPEGKYDIRIDLIFDIPEDEQPSGSRYEENCRKFTTKFGAEKVIATGSFSLQVNNTDKVALSRKLSKDLPKAAKTDAALEQGMIKATTGMWEGQTPVKAIITSGDWLYHRDVWGNITHRTINAAVVIKFEKENVYEVFNMVFGEQNQGGDKYGAPYYAGGNTDEGDYFIAKEFVK